MYCKIIEEKVEKDIRVPTGEEIATTSFDPKHGTVETGETVDGYVAYSDIQYKIQIPGVDDPIWIDSKFCNS